MRLDAVLPLALLLLLGSSSGAAEKVLKESIRSQGKERGYYLFVPGQVSAAAPVPLVVLLHGAGRDGSSLVERWRELARQEGFIIAGPDALSSRGWKIPEDGPDFVYELVEALKAKHPIDARRVYLFGHSSGAGHALYLSVLESEYFAATVAHAGTVGVEAHPLMERAPRKIPIAIYVGTNDRFVPLPAARATRDALDARGFKPQLSELRGHTHSYYDRAGEINRDAWGFLKAHRLGGEPKYERYQFGE